MNNNNHATFSRASLSSASLGSLLHPVCTLAVLACLVLSGLRASSRLGWLPEATVVCVVGALLLRLHRRQPLTALTVLLLSLFAAVILYGAAYGFTQVPLGFWMERVLGLSRNPYDRLGHFLQGFVPALLVRELLLARGQVAHRGLASVLAGCAALALSALYEITQWRAAVFFGVSPEQFLGMQGDPWDSQADMAMALMGAVLALLLLSRLQDRQMAALRARRA